MQHEVLLALLGHTGEVIVDIAGRGYEVNRALPESFVSVSEREVCRASLQCNVCAQFNFTAA